MNVCEGEKFGPRPKSPEDQVMLHGSVVDALGSRLSWWRISYVGGMVGIGCGHALGYATPSLEA